MTAIEWLEEQMFNLQIELKKERMPLTKYESIRLELLEQAKEMEKEQIKDAYDEGAEEWCDGFYVVDISSESYYNKTFK